MKIQVQLLWKSFMTFSFLIIVSIAPVHNVTFYLLFFTINSRKSYLYLLICTFIMNGNSHFFFFQSVPLIQEENEITNTKLV